MLNETELNRINDFEAELIEQMMREGITELTVGDKVISLVNEEEIEVAGDIPEEYIKEEKIEKHIVEKKDK